MLFTENDAGLVAGREHSPRTATGHYRLEAEASCQIRGSYFASIQYTRRRARCADVHAFVEDVLELLSELSNRSLCPGMLT